ncbi:histidine kinase [Sphaerisporangium sp. NPDC051011]|uniref:sensor histidine kinase n=1 Tax=Sphaerisporangium sp. NPDC051011 TaxID=3155792 RepID=UPI0033CE6AAB
MDVTPPFPLPRRVPPAAWTVLAWCAGLAFTFLLRVRLPGEWYPAERSGVLLYRWTGLTSMAPATAAAVAGALVVGRRPLAGMLLSLAGSVIASLPLGVAEIPMAQFLAVDLALFFVTASRPPRVGAAALAMAFTVLAGYLATRLLAGWVIGTSAELAVAMTAVIAWLAGRSARQAREHAASMRAQAEARAATDERLRIAREVHDTVAHSIGIIALQAGAARRVIDTRPERAREALGAIETVGREALTGLRLMLGGLREPGPGAPPRPPLGQASGVGSGPGHEPASWRGRESGLGPVLGLADVERLAATATDAGVRVDVRWQGERRPLPAEVDACAFRIVQEAVTNVVRHAGAPSCQVSIDYGEDELSIEVLDGGREAGTPAGDGSDMAARGGYGVTARGGRDAAVEGGHSVVAENGRDAAAEGGYGVTADGGHGGHGLAGMRERVRLLRGTFFAGARAEGGFRVAARLPVPVRVR